MRALWIILLCLMPLTLGAQTPMSERPGSWHAAPPPPPALTQAARADFRIGVAQCWNIGSLSKEAQRTTVVVGFEMSREGRPVDGTLRLVSYDGGSQAAAQQAYEAARRAILRCGTNGYAPTAERLQGRHRHPSPPKARHGLHQAVPLAH